jgi:hypothetical protein
VRTNFSKKVMAVSNERPCKNIVDLIKCHILLFLVQRGEPFLHPADPFSEYENKYDDLGHPPQVH